MFLGQKCLLKMNFFQNFLTYFGSVFGPERSIFDRRRPLERPWWSKGGPRAPKSSFVSHLGRISGPCCGRFCIDFRSEIMSEIEVEKKRRKTMTKHKKSMKRKLRT